ncbi:trypsin-like peptidase domain-containing protein [Candidatus Pacearchaeota archaeon]|nr:trypsin-like peptidase domain-containing protein [Candidatus Pacearchaeota archaeon]
MGKIHITITSVTIVLQIVMIASLVYLVINMIEIKNSIELTINKTKTDLEKQITDNQVTNQQQIQEVTTNLMSTKASLSNQISEIKADTSSDFSGVIQDVIKGVVSVGTDISQGSGFIISNEGYVITNAHVLSGGRYARVLTYESDSWRPAQLIGYDNDMDIAILKIQGNYDSLEFDNSDEVQVGEKAIALGNPLGLSFSVSEGIISAVNRLGPNNQPIYFQIDVPLNRGNSGGPLVNKRGKVIGVNNFKLQNAENLGFALESNYAKEAINKIFAEQNLSISI